MIRLFTTAFSERDEIRRAEYRRAFEANVSCPAIEEIHVLDEGDNDLAPLSNKITRHPIERRPTYGQFFERIDSLAEATDISIIANTDIYFDIHIRVTERFLKPNQCFALSRWDLRPSGEPALFDRRDSQDSWIFRGRIGPVRGDIPLGVPRCDNRIAHEIALAGYEVLNPSLGIKTYHLHGRERGEYPIGLQEGFVEPPYKYIWPHNLLGFLPRTLYNLSQKEIRLGYRLDDRKLRRLKRRLRRLLLLGRRGASDAQ